MGVVEWQANGWACQNSGGVALSSGCGPWQSVTWRALLVLPPFVVLAFGVDNIGRQLGPQVPGLSSRFGTSGKNLFSMKKEGVDPNVIAALFDSVKGRQ